jgi:hypothetical protein
MTLEEALDRLAALLPTAQARWEAQRCEEKDYAPDDEQLWLTLEYDGALWRCAYVYQPDEATEVAYAATEDSAIDAAAALLAMMEQ